MSIFKKIFGDSNQKYLSKIQFFTDEINFFGSKLEKLSPERLKEKTSEFKEKLKSGQSLDDILPEAFALVREASKRTLKQRHFDVQLIGGIVLHQGKIAEMKTGEGKTLSATLPLYLNALEEKGCHLITVNDYLARRDTVWMGQVYNFLGISVGCITHDQSFLYDANYKTEDQEKDKVRDELGGFKVVDDFLRPASRKEAYGADITYGTNNEFGFDYLKDNMAPDGKEVVQRGFNFVIIDEVDSVLIDEARTPLIISTPDAESTKMYEEFSVVVPSLKESVDFNIDEKMKAATLTEEGIEKVEKLLGKSGLYERQEIRLIHHLEQAIKAQFLFKKDKDYVVKEGQVIIVDDFTGRLLPGRRFSDGLHQAIEAKEGVRVQQESRTLATVTLQNYFRMYKKLAGMTGTAITSAEEFSKVYKLDVVAVPTNLSMIRKDLSDKIYKDEKAKFAALVGEIKEINEKGQPILVGTTSIEKNEYLGKLLQREGVSHKILNAKRHEEEGAIIAQAGRLGAVTIATNMAGRGVDITLGGNPPDEKELKRVKDLGGLHIIGTERHEARRIDDQLRGRSGRQGDPGSSQFFVSTEDDIVRIFGGENIKSIMERFNFPEDMPIEHSMISRVIEKAQAKVEGYNFDARKHLLEFDDVLNKQRIKVYNRRKDILTVDKSEQENISFKIIKNQIEKIIDFHTSYENPSDWNLKEIYEEIKIIIISSEEAERELISIMKIESALEESRQKIKNYLTSLAEFDFKSQKEKIGEDFNRVLRVVQLRIIDILWMEHLENMESLRDSVRLRAYGQIDPLVAYRNEGYKLFQSLLENFEKEVANKILKVEIRREEPQPEKKHILSHSNSQSSVDKTKPVSAQQKIGRNDACPCGKINSQTGKPMKYKKCCWPKYD